MEFVQPIRDKKQLEAMKKILKATSIRDYCLFILGINSGLRISDLLTLKVSDVTDEKGKIKDRISLREQKTGKFLYSIVFTQLLPLVLFVQVVDYFTQP